MATTWYPCPNCGQAQKEEHEPGAEVTPHLCPACQEEKDIQAELEAEGVLEDARTARKKAPAR